METFLATFPTKSGEDPFARKELGGTLFRSFQCKNGENSPGLFPLMHIQSWGPTASLSVNLILARF